MADATQVGVVYGADDLLIYEIIVPDHDTELDDPAFVRSGRVMMRIDHPVYQQHGDHESLAKAIGLLG